jgi:hypothetical protein
LTGKIYDELSAGFADYPKLKQVEKLIDDNGRLLFPAAPYL